MGEMKKDHFYAEFLGMMREQGRKDNPTLIQIGVMQSSNSVKINDLILNAEDLYIADYLMAGYSRALNTPYVSSVEPERVQSQLVYSSGLKAGDLVAVQDLGNNKYVILARVVQV